jgi:hypothetical protein
MHFDAGVHIKSHLLLNDTSVNPAINLGTAQHRPRIMAHELLRSQEYFSFPCHGGIFHIIVLTRRFRHLRC